jgi:hypothetical protein
MSTLKGKLQRPTPIPDPDGIMEAQRQCMEERRDLNIGKKFDAEKPDLSLLPKAFLDGTARAFMHGEKKYGRYNYCNGMDWHRLVASLLRHATEFNEGIDIDAESGLHVLDLLGANVAMLQVYVTENLGTDDRRKK